MKYLSKKDLVLKHSEREKYFTFCTTHLKSCVFFIYFYPKFPIYQKLLYFTKRFIEQILLHFFFKTKRDIQKEASWLYIPLCYLVEKQKVKKNSWCSFWFDNGPLTLFERTYFRGMVNPILLHILSLVISQIIRGLPHI